MVSDPDERQRLWSPPDRVRALLGARRIGVRALLGARRILLRSRFSCTFGLPPSLQQVVSLFIDLRPNGRLTGTSGGVAFAKTFWPASCRCYELK